MRYLISWPSDTFDDPRCTTVDGDHQDVAKCIEDIINDYELDEDAAGEIKIYEISNELAFERKIIIKETVKVRLK